MTNRQRQALVLVAVLAVLAIGLVLGAALFGDDDGGSDLSAEGTTTTAAGGDDEASTTTAGPGEDGDEGLLDLAPPTTVETDDLDGAALELAEAINRAFELDYHAVYAGQFAAQDGGTTDVTAEIWRDRPLARRDTSISQAGQPGLRTREFRLADRIIGCIDTADSGGEPKFQCLDAQGRGVDPADPLLGAVDAHAGRVTATDEMFGSIPVRCFAVEATEGTQRACFDADGVPAVIDGGDGRLERVEVDDATPEEVFEPPPSSPTSTPS